MWKTVNLGDILSLQNGYAFKSNEYVDEGYFVMRITNVQQGYISAQNPKYISIDASSKLSKFILSEGDILISLTGDVGRVGTIEEKHLPAALNQRVARVTDVRVDTVDKNFLFMFLNSDTFRKLVEELSHGAAQANVSTKDILSINFELPPLAEQQRIVEKLDRAFEEIDRAIEATQESIANTKKLSAHAIDSAFGEYMAMSEELGKHSAINYGYTAKASFEKGLYKFLRITDIKDSGVDWENVPYCDVEDEKISKMLLHDGDIVFARTGATTGKSFLVENPSNAVFASYLIRVSLDRNVLVPRYVMHYFQSASYWLQVNEGTTGAAQGGFNASKLSELKIPIISKDKQENLISKLDAMGNEIADYALTQNMKIAHYENLKSAILAQELKGPES